MENKKQINNNDFYKGIILGIFIVFFIFLGFILGFKIGQKDFNPRRMPPFFHPFLNKKEDFFVPKKLKGHGLVGIVESVGEESFIVKNRLGELITVLVDKNTQYKKDNQNVSFSEIKKGRNIFIIGEPLDKEPSLKAVIIRIFN